MQSVKQIFRVGFIGAICTFFTSGCVHDMYYEPAKIKDYSSDAGFAGNTPADDYGLAAAEPTMAHYTGSNRVERERYKDPNVLGNLHLKGSSDPQEDGLKFAIRKEHRGYSAETPIGESFEINGNKVTPNFALGVHKDHKAMVGFVFRMPF